MSVFSSCLSVIIACDEMIVALWVQVAPTAKRLPSCGNSKVEFAMRSHNQFITCRLFNQS